jgi:hypothetical protein
VLDMQLRRLAALEREMPDDLPAVMADVRETMHTYV